MEAQKRINELKSRVLLAEQLDEATLREILTLIAECLQAIQFEKVEYR